MRIEVRDGDVVIGAGIAELARPDLPPELGDGHYGFAIQTSNLQYASFRSGRIEVSAVSEIGLRHSLPFGPRITLAADIAAFIELISRSKRILTNLPEIIEDVAVCFAPQERDVSHWLLGLNTLLRNPDRVPPQGLLNLELSALNFPVGLIGGDGSAVIGRNGNVFLAGNRSSSPDILFRPGSPTQGIIDIAEGWHSLFQRRGRSLSERNIRYLQIIIPEKNSIIPKELPFAWESPSSLLQNIEQRVENNQNLSIQYISCLDVLRDANSQRPVIRKVDTHLTPYGAFSIVAALLSRIGHNIGIPNFSVRRIVHADLAARFFGSPFFDEVYDADLNQEQEFTQSVKTMDRFAPPDGAHIGRRLITSNQNAPVPLTAVAFANSFFDFEEAGQSGLSWWFSRWFREFHFLWSPAIDYEYIDKVRPGLVVCQTIERYLPSLPPD